MAQREPGSSDQGGSIPDVLSRYWAAARHGDLEALRDLFADAFVMEWPQSGERFNGRRDAMAAMATMGGLPPVIDGPRIRGCGDVWVAEATLGEGASVTHYVVIYEVRDDRIVRGTGYFATPFPADPARDPFVDRG
jgi:ketosteroid isomerase-like protein